MNADRELKRLELDNEIASFTSNFLNDIVIDETTNFAYITDAGDASMVIYDFNRNRARKFTSRTMLNEPDVDITINGVDYGNSTFTTPIDGIALKKGQTVWYCAL